jgi:hypothetical protein
MQDLVPENAIDYDEVFRRGGRNLGDEDFALFKCPACGRIYLLEYEVDTAYLDPDDLSVRASVFTTPLIALTVATGFPTMSRGLARRHDKNSVSRGQN